MYAISTLGFRGEALYSIGAVSKLTVNTRSVETGEGSVLVIDNGKREDIISSSIDKGTIVSAENLFSDIPARRAFLKRESTEGNLCRTLLISKALAFPNVRFTFIVDGAIRLDWPKCSSLKERVMFLYRSEGIADADVEELHFNGEDYSIDIVAGNSSIKRSDRREIRIYVNKRPVEEYSLQQAVSFGYGELLPGGAFPYASVFIEDAPELTDFNIHPAKKEVKLRNKAEIHHAITVMLQNGIKRKIPEIAPFQPEFYLDEKKKQDEPRSSSYSIPQSSSWRNENLSERVSIFKTKDNSWLEKAKALKENHERKQAEEEKKNAVTVPVEKKAEDEIIYIGQAFKLFLICQKGDSLYLVDQHAAHERILYDELLSQKTVQNLLVPIKLETDNLMDEFLSKHSEVYTKLGIMLSRKDNGEWEITALPASCRASETEIVDFISSQRLDEHELESKLFAIIACRAAIKSGDDIDRWIAEELLKKVFALEEPACPHGRTFLIKLTEKNLREMVGRTI